MLDAADILGAQERMAAIADGAVATGNLKKGQSRSHIRRLEKAAEKGHDRGALTAGQSTKSGIADLQAFGISVVKQSPKGAGAGSA